MNAHQAVELADKDARLQAILIQGIHCVAGRRAIERAEARGVEFSYLHKWNDGKVIAVPNYDTRGK